MDEQLNPGELEEVIRSKEAHSRAVVLESIGDIPDAEVKPPDNVLFVCKLNPVTEDEDLHTIFSRFGTVSSAEIIRDHKTGDSLCYAFIVDANLVEATESNFNGLNEVKIADDEMFIKNFVMGQYEIVNFHFIQSIKVAFGCFNKICVHYCNAQEI
ncbi:peptidyl-prolyl cis-trans isomerase 4-like protein [Trifolium pratense]|uniref:peptidylprolyl isomerase n=1 Tax=Trifolium pratense TaxID=57577 RepID=A0A2K3N1B3_TRIPR|nr:peptidyl-prolyl cis-trans isomerase 4-like protein [Trifolium pratense]